MEHFPPDQILPLGDVVAVSAKGSAVFLFDAVSTNFLRTFDVYPMTKNLVTGKSLSINRLAIHILSSLTPGSPVRKIEPGVNII